MLFENMSKIGTGASNQQGKNNTNTEHTDMGGRRRSGCSATITSTFLAGLVLVVPILGTKIQKQSRTQHG